MSPDLIGIYMAAIIGGLFAIGAAFMGGKYLGQNREDEEDSEVQRAIGRLEGRRAGGIDTNERHIMKIVEERVNLLHGTLSSIRTDLVDTRTDIRDNRISAQTEHRETRMLVASIETKVSAIEAKVGTLVGDVTKLQSAMRVIRGRRQSS